MWGFKTTKLVQKLQTIGMWRRLVWQRGHKLYTITIKTYVSAEILISFYQTISYHTSKQSNIYLTLHFINLQKSWSKISAHSCPVSCFCTKISDLENAYGCYFRFWIPANNTQQIITRHPASIHTQHYNCNMDRFYVSNFPDNSYGFRALLSLHTPNSQLVLRLPVSW